MQSRFFKQSCLPSKEKTYLSSGNYKTFFYNSLLSCLSCQNRFMFLNRGQHVDVTDFLAEDKGELLFLFDTSSRKVFREENHPFRRNAWTLMKFIPGVHTTWHMCVFHDQYILTNDVLHIALCVNIISFPLEFSFEFI